MAVYEVKSEFGEIRVKNGVVIQVIRSVMETLRGKVVFSDAKGKPVKLKGEDGGESIWFHMAEDGLHIRLFLVARFGSSIRQTVTVLGRRIRREIDRHFGKPPAEIEVVITGVATTEGIIPRKIVFRV